MQALRLVAERQLKDQTGDREPCEVPKLVFVEVPLISPETLGLYVGLRSLRLCCLRPPLQGELMLPPLPNLKILNVCDNKITSVSPNLKLPKLQQLFLANNKVADLGSFKALATGCPLLVNIDLEGNVVTKANKSHRSDLFEIIPTLQVVSDQDRNGQEIDVDDSDDEEEEEDSDEEDEDEEEDDDEEEEESDTEGQQGVVNGDKKTDDDVSSKPADATTSSAPAASAGDPALWAEALAAALADEGPEASDDEEEEEEEFEDDMQQEKAIDMPGETTEGQPAAKKQRLEQ